MDIEITRTYKRYPPVIEAYNNLTNYEYETVAEFATEEEARAEWTRREYEKPYTLEYCRGWVNDFYFGEVYELEYVEVDEDGEFTDWETLEFTLPEYPQPERS